MFTSLENLYSTENNHKISEINIEDDVKNLSRNIQDLDIPLEDRIKCVQKFYDLFPTDLHEYISRLISNYELYGLKIVKEYLISICYNTNIEYILKANIGQALCNNKDHIGYEILDYICKNYQDISTTYKISLIKILAKNLKFKENVNTYFQAILENTNLDNSFRYKNILSFEKLEISEEIKTYFINNFCFVYAMNRKNEKKYRIFACQILLKNKFNFETIENLLLSFTEEEKEENVKADIADIILQYGSSESKEKAQKILKELIKSGNQGKRVTNI